MKAIIMNAGVGKRMYEITEDKPKCLVEISEGKNILGRQLETLVNNEIKDVIMTTGYYENKIKEYIKINFSGLNVRYVYNPKYNSTNCIYSLFLTKQYIDDDVIFMTGDLVFEENVFQRILNSQEQNVVLVNNKVEPPKKDFKARIEDEVVKEIGVNVFGRNCFFSLPMYKFSRGSFLLWLNEIENFVKEGKTNVQAEEAFNVISSKINLKPVYFDDEFCTEIDNNDELELVRSYFSKK
jgi:phosphoenolpyruvate phosphomutase